MRARPPFRLPAALALAAALASPATAHTELDAPNGGEVLTPGAVVTIQWHVTVPHETLDWDLSYSVTGPDGPWLPIADDLPLGSNEVDVPHFFDWTVPDTPSAQVRVRVVQDNVETDWDDVSDADLTIVPGSPGTASCFGVGCPCGNDDPQGGCANSSGSGATLTGSGTASALADDLVLDAALLPTGNSGLFYMGDTTASNAFFDGRQCAVGTAFRFLCCIQNSGATGTMTLGPGIVARSEGMIVPGTTWHFHCWFRDSPTSPCGSEANLSHLYSVTFTP